MRQSDRTTRHDEQRRTHNDDVAGVGELRAVAERILDAGARALESGRDWLTARSRREHAPDDEEDGNRRHDDGAARHHRASRSARWPDDATGSAGAAGVYGADAGSSNASRRHRGEGGSGPRHRAGRRDEPYAPDEYAYPESGGHASAGRDRYEDHDHRSSDFDAHWPGQQAGGGRQLHGIGPARASGRSFGPRRRDHVADDRPGRFDSGRDHEFDHLPGSFGYGGEYRRDLSAQPGGSGPDVHDPEHLRGRDDAGDTGRRMGHAGRGPKGYTRPDERILDDVNERLSDDPLVDARDIEVRCEQGTITLGGRVGARWVKHRAEDIADSVAGVKDIDNRIRVGPVDPAAARDASAVTRASGPGSEATGPGESADDRTDRDPPPQQPH